MAEIELSKYIASLREELLSAIENAETSDLKFGLEKVEVEVVFDASSAVKAGGKFKLWVFDASAGGEAKLESKRTQKLKIGLLPSYRGKDAFVSEESSSAAR
ncbi:trypco2 family protein [Bradyrhizobium japonicum]|uniref:trypco2 family protein n=1 Tax=Bradyrhizobium japonicum TaxID=375 RepID=UPI001E5B9F5D|nr:trypco2 family protein [Bradyrhizobium japonicum]MCD9824068.1 hypothetical protein [Bradyrhizobium japonicum]MCD9896622.1 hypothetical protein [Bradyrhizobium japonicum]MEB2671114.1 trypco2 family protein [Bradyrhizobium japonicum]WLB28644.1 hypothetical protein QIH85_43930 [Bradyrhizobium japonicum]WRI90437.1 trypco2 family protein [Bradyrhizobium japonicum]